MWYLSTDHAQLREAMRAKLPHKLAYFPAPHRRGYSPRHNTSVSTSARCLAEPRCRRREELRSLIATMQEWWVMLPEAVVLQPLCLQCMLAGASFRIFLDCSVPVLCASTTCSHSTSSPLCRYLLSLCDYIVMDGGSGFSATALGRTFRNDSA